MPLVFVSNDPDTSELRNQWRDVTGVRYHYPNMYRRMIKPGEQFVYYRGVHREQGPRGPATYFGTGVVGDVWPDPETIDNAARNRGWYCSVENYVPFATPVMAKTDGVFLEDIPTNMFRSGVRKLPEQSFLRIVGLGGVSAALVGDATPAIAQIPIDEVIVPTASSPLLAPPTTTQSGRTGSGSRVRRSRHAKIIGDRAEQIALRWIAANVSEARDVKWLANAGETPGWDIQYLDATGAIVGIEVKGASGSAFANFEVTANELAAAKTLGGRYVILLVSDCLSKRPSVQVISDLNAGIELGLYAIEPTGWKVSRKAGASNV